MPQATAHLRRYLELMIAGAFLSATFVEVQGRLWNPFSDLYLADLWQHYTVEQSLTVRAAAKLAKEKGVDSGKMLEEFTTFYLENIARPVCATHIEALRRENVQRGLSLPIYYFLSEGDRKCSADGCGGPMAAGVIDLPPNLQLMLHVARAGMGNAGFSADMVRNFESLYARTSRFVHVTREAHRHDLGLDEKDVRGWSSVTRGLLSWGLKSDGVVWRHHSVALPGVDGLLDAMGWDAFSQHSRVVKKEVCRLYMATLGSESRTAWWRGERKVKE